MNRAVRIAAGGGSHTLALSGGLCVRALPVFESAG